MTDIGPNPYQPRREFDEQLLAELAESISQQGILQPLVVTKDFVHPDYDVTYTLIAGERRLRAAQLAGLERVPCIIRKATQQQMLEWALIENIQRADLDPIDRALAYREYIDRFHINQTQAAHRLGQSRLTVLNYLKLLELCDELQQMLSRGDLSFGHAKVLSSLAGQPAKQLELARKVFSANLSVRQLEQMVGGKAIEVPAAPAARTSAGRTKPAYLLDLEQRLTTSLGTRVAILPGKNRNTGRIVVDFYSLDDFDRIAARLGVAGESMPGS